MLFLSFDACFEVDAVGDAVHGQLTFSLNLVFRSRAGQSGRRAWDGQAGWLKAGAALIAARSSPSPALYCS